MSSITRLSDPSSRKTTNRLRAIETCLSHPQLPQSGFCRKTTNRLRAIETTGQSLLGFRLSRVARPLIAFGRLKLIWIAPFLTTKLMVARPLIAFGRLKRCTPGTLTPNRVGRKTTNRLRAIETCSHPWGPIRHRHRRKTTNRLRAIETCIAAICAWLCACVARPLIAFGRLKLGTWNVP